MIDSLFRFKGRLNRVQHFAASSCVSLVAGLVIVVVLLTMQHLRGERATIPGTWVLAATPFALPVLWAYLSMQAARLRDIGVSPFNVIAALVVINIASVVIVAIVPSGSFANVIAGFSKAANAAYGFAILLLPSNFVFGIGTLAPFNPAPTNIEPNRAARAKSGMLEPPIFGTRKAKRP